MNILEGFWYGNIEPAEYDTSSSKEYKELLQLISRNACWGFEITQDLSVCFFNMIADTMRSTEVNDGIGAVIYNHANSLECDSLYSHHIPHW